MAGAKTAKKNARTSPTSKAPATIGDARLLVPCNGGKNAYVRDVVNGQNPNLRTDSEQFVAVVASLVEAGHGDRVRAELAALTEAHPSHGWDTVRERLEVAGALG